MGTAFRAGCFLIAAALVAACGRSHSPDGSVDGGRPDAPPEDAGAADASDAASGDAGIPEAVERFFAAVDAELCRIALLCDSSLRRGDGMGGVWPLDPLMASELPCHPAFERSGTWDAVHRKAVRAAVATGRVRFDPGAAATCLDGLRTTAHCLMGASTCDWWDVFIPFVPEGGRCSVYGFTPDWADSVECASGLRCATDGGCEGICAPLLPAGEPCRTYGDCLGWCRDGTCIRPPAAGEPCFVDSLDSWCDVDLRCVDGLCAARDPIGAACEPGSCITSAVCVPQPDGSAVCTDLSTSTEGGPCYGSWRDTCPGALMCNADDTTGLWTCGAGEAAGGPCALGHPCAEGLRCDEGTCRALVLPGEPCDAEHLCPITHYCGAAGICAPLPVLGEPCTDSGRCIEGMCLEGACRLAPVGAECTGIARAPFGSCEGYCSDEFVGVCAESLPDGASCFTNDQCAAGSACSGACEPWCGLGT